MILFIISSAVLGIGKLDKVSVLSLLSLFPSMLPNLSSMCMSSGSILPLYIAFLFILVIIYSSFLYNTKSPIAKYFFTKPLITSVGCIEYLSSIKLAIPLDKFIVPKCLLNGQITMSLNGS